MTTYANVNNSVPAAVLRAAHKALAQEAIRHQYREREDRIRRFALGARADWK